MLARAVPAEFLEGYRGIARLHIAIVAQAIVDLVHPDERIRRVAYRDLCLRDAFPSADALGLDRDYLTDVAGRFADYYLQQHPRRREHIATAAMGGRHG